MFSAPRNGVSASDQRSGPEAEGQPNLRAQKQQARRNVRSQAASRDRLQTSMRLRATPGRSHRHRFADRAKWRRPAPVQVFTCTQSKSSAQLRFQMCCDIRRSSRSRAPNIIYQSGAQYSQMRGIGVDTTLVLINGTAGRADLEQPFAERIRSEQRAARGGGKNRSAVGFRLGNLRRGCDRRRHQRGVQERNPSARHRRSIRRSAGRRGTCVARR